MLSTFRYAERYAQIIQRSPNTAPFATVVAMIAEALSHWQCLCGLKNLTCWTHSLATFSFGNVISGFSLPDQAKLLSHCQLLGCLRRDSRRLESPCRPVLPDLTSTLCPEYWANRCGSEKTCQHLG